MKLLIAKSAGFCMGVHRAVEMVLDAPNKHESPIYTYGPLIHNPQVLTLLEEKGISILHKIPESGCGTVLIRAHGVPPQVKEKLKKAGFKVIDATCPRVIKVQTIIHKHARRGYTTIIIGDKDHPEVLGLLGYAGKNGHVVDTIEDLHALPAFGKAIVVAQTTQNTLFFQEVKEWVARNYPAYKIFDTICDSTEKRQAEVKKLLHSVDALIVVGGRESGNTQRLAEIGRQGGKSAYHIETESDLDFQALTSARRIGITAGASTPNWIIERVYRAIETLLSKKAQGWRRVLFVIQRTLLLTNIYVSLGAGCLCYACTKLQGIQYVLPAVLISMLYVQSMHIFNNLTGREADRYNDPDRASFYIKHRAFLAGLAVTAGAIGLITAHFMGRLPFVLLLFMSIMGFSYNLRLVPNRFAGLKYQRMRDIPGSKTVLIAVAWGILAAIFPPLVVSGTLTFSSFVVFLWAACMVFVRTAFFDILDMQGDRIVGQETIPTIFGENATMRLLKSLLAISFCLLIFSSASRILSSLGFVLAFCPVFIFIVLSAHQRRHMLPGIRLEFLIETFFVLAGIITLFWSTVIH